MPAAGRSINVIDEAYSKASDAECLFWHKSEVPKRIDDVCSWGNLDVVCSLRAFPLLPNPDTLARKTAGRLFLQSGPLWSVDRNALSHGDGPAIQLTGWHLSILRSISNAGVAVTSRPRRVRDTRASERFAMPLSTNGIGGVW